MSTLNRVMLTTIAVVFVVLSLSIVLAAHIMFTKSVNDARGAYADQAEYTARRIWDNIDFTGRLLKLTQQSLAELDPKSHEAHAAATQILLAMMDSSRNVNSAWFIFETGVYYENRRYAKDYVKHNGVITEIFDTKLMEQLKSPESAPWYYEPLTTG